MPAAKKRVEILRTGNWIVVDPSTPRIRGLLEPRLTYVERVFLRGREKFLARKAGAPTAYSQDWECFGEDHKGRIATSYGFAEGIAEVLGRAGYEVEVVDLAPCPDPTVYRPRLDLVFEDPDLEWRYKQKAVLRAIAEHDNGRIDCPTGYGKSYLIGLACRVFPRARVDVVSTAVAVVRDRIYPELVQMGLDVGIVGGGKSVKGRRVMCFTVGSLHHGRHADADFVFFDESHEAASDQAAAQLARYTRARMWGFSASHDMRLDNKDMRCEAMFGPVRLRVSYRKACDKGMVVQLVVMMGSVRMDVDPAADLEDTDKLRAGIWANDYRNAKIAKDARSYGDDMQTLITVATLEHALYLKRELPEFELVYNGDNVESRDLEYYAKLDLLPPGFRVLTPERQARITRRFEKGSQKKVIVTTVWNRGVNMKHLEVLIRGDAGGSPINDVQIPGRASRIDGRKVAGVVHDYLDQFNRGFEAKALRRMKSYRRLGFEIIMPGKAARPRLNEIMGWDG